MLARWLEGAALCGVMLGAMRVAAAQDLPPVADVPALAAVAAIPSEPALPSAARVPSDTQVVAGDLASPGTTAPGPATGPAADAEKYRWLDRTHQEVYDAVWHSSMKVDRWFGSELGEQTYQNGAYGSLAPAILYDQYNHIRTQLRFNANFPLPQIDDRFHAFVGRVNPQEFITERDEPSGAFQRQYGPATEDQTIFGLSFHEPHTQGGYFDAGAGVRIALPMDPYVKGSYVFEHGASEHGLLSLRETLYWEHSDGVGVTSRIDLERIFDLRWLVRWTASATVSQESRGTRGYSSLLAMRGFPNRHALALEIGFDGESKAPVELHDYGLKAAYRQCILRRWLVMEVRASVDWPKDFVYQHRNRSLGIGLGFEMLFGTDEFLARPVTF